MECMSTSLVQTLSRYSFPLSLGESRDSIKHTASWLTRLRRTFDEAASVIWMCFLSPSLQTSWTRVLKAAGAEAVPKLPSTHQLVKDEPDEGTMCVCVM